jgi:hypothetical protein
VFRAIYWPQNFFYQEHSCEYFHELLYKKYFSIFFYVLLPENYFRGPDPNPEKQIPLFFLNKKKYQFFFLKKWGGWGK